MSAKTRWIWRSLSLAMVFMMAFSPLSGISAPVTAQNENLPASNVQVELVAPVVQGSETGVPSDQVLAKFDEYLRGLVEGSTLSLPAEFGMRAPVNQEPILIDFATSQLDDEQLAQLESYFVDSKLYGSIPNTSLPFQMYVGKIAPANLIKIASLSYVQAIYSTVPKRNEVEGYPADDTVTEPGPRDWTELRANADSLRASALPWDQAKAFNDGRTDYQPKDWYDMSYMGPTKAEVAWERGYTGEGVSVSVIDDGVDFAHPDLMGVQKIYSSTQATEYNGWPMVMDPFSMRAYFYQLLGGTPAVSYGHPGVTYIDTHYTPAVSTCGVGISCYQFTPLIDYGMLGFNHTYVISNTMTKSGVIHAGTLTDESLRDYVWGEKVALLVTDPHKAGVYDTVYIDLNDDYDFRDEKPLTKADVSDPMTYNNMIAYRDMDGDGLADLSGGMLYYISDGNLWVPGFEAMFDPGYYDLDPPDAGDLIAVHGPWNSGYSHGTQCASNVAGQGTVNGLLPSFADLPGDGKPDGAVFGAAPDVGLVPMNTSWGYSGNITYIDAYFMAALGWDGYFQYEMEDTDAIQATSNSYGFSDEFNDGWDYLGQVIDFLMIEAAPSMQFLFSTGNGGPGYGTVTPPSPGLGIAVGASTEYGSTGWDTITYTNQINYNDVAAFSNSGPGARDGVGVDVLAGGAYAAGDEALNYYSISIWGELDGNRSWDSWGGTSRSSPVTLGVLALIYQAYKDAHGVWPTNQEAKAILMSSATDVNTDVYKQGAGAVNADVGTAVAAGLYGAYAADDSAYWNPGDYRGDYYPGFAHLVSPGESYTKTFTMVNDGDTAVHATVGTSYLELIDESEFDFTVTADMVAAESVFGSSNSDNFYKAFQYMIPLTATESADAFMHNIDIPAETDLMVVRQIYPYDEFDVNGDYNWDNRFYLMVYNWTDVNSDGSVWDDKNSNGVVNFINDPSTFGTLIDGGIELAWDDPRTEVQRWEYARFGYNRPYANVNELIVQDPLNRMHDGLFIGLRHLFNSNASDIDTHLQYRIEFYKKSNVSWLGTDTNDLNIPAHGIATFEASADIPVNIPAGDYAAAIEVYDPGPMPLLESNAPAPYSDNTIIIPVGINVVTEFNGSATFGGQTASQYDEDVAYNNGLVRGYFDWGWREESGDWRFFYMDIPDSLPEGSRVIVRDEWDDAAPHTDIDTIVLGPTGTALDGVRWGDWSSDLSDPNFYGPYTLETVASSPDVRSGRSIWNFNTSSGANVDWVSFDLQEGLHELMQHNVLFEGDKFGVVFTKTVGMLMEDVHSFDIVTDSDKGIVGNVVLTSTIPLSGLTLDGYIISRDEIDYTDEPLPFVDSSTIEWAKPFTVEDATSIDISTSSSDVADLDLYLFYLGTSGLSQVASSAGPDASEHIHFSDPENGTYYVGINNYSGPAGHFNMTINMMLRKAGLTATTDHTGPLAANTPATITINYDFPFVAGEPYTGKILVGSSEAAELKAIDVSIMKVDNAIEKTVDKSVAFQGDELNYTMKLYDVFGGASVLLTDPLPSGTEFVAASSNATYDSSGKELTFDGTLDQTEIITLTVRVADDVADGTIITNTATISSTALSNEQTASATTQIGVPEFTESSKDATSAVKPGEIIDYVVHIMNSGSKLINVSMTDPIPAGTTFDDLVDVPGAYPFEYNATLDQVEWSGPVGPGAEVTLYFSVEASTDLIMGDVVTNTATLSWGEDTMDLTATTEILPVMEIYFPTIPANYSVSTP